MRFLLPMAASKCSTVHCEAKQNICRHQIKTKVYNCDVFLACCPRGNRKKETRPDKHGLYDMSSPGGVEWQREFVLHTNLHGLTMIQVDSTLLSLLHPRILLPSPVQSYPSLVYVVTTLLRLLLMLSKPRILSPAKAAVPPGFTTS